jgi:hypothetical protein
VTSSSSVGATSDEASQLARARRLTTWSWLMVPSLVVSYTLAYAVGTLLMGALDVPEGELITSAGGPGWLAGACVTAIGVAPLVCGVALASRALRYGAGSSAKAGRVVNGILLVWLLASQILQMALS